MSTIVETDEIEEQLRFFNLTASKEVLDKMKQLCFMHKFDAETIVEHVVAFASSKKINLNPNIKMLDQMEKEVIMKPKTVKNRKSNLVTAPVYNSSTIDDIYEPTDVTKVSNQDNRSNLTAKTPGLFSPNSISPACFTPSMKYSSRKGIGEIVCSFGKLEDVKWKLSVEFSCSVSAYNKNTVVKGEYNYMCEKLRDLASILNDMIQDAALVFKEKLEIEDWGHIQLPSVETIPVIGRICTDSTNRLSSSAIYFESSQEISSGQCIPLDVSNLDQFSFFPGQIIAGLGTNSTGKKLVLKEVYEGIHPTPSEKVQSLKDYCDSLSVVVAAGPFATSDTLSYEPLQDLMKYVKIHCPHVLILIGPFLDEKNQMIENNELTETFENIFDGIISEIMNQVNNLHTKVILVPSTRDAHHHNIYPTPPYNIKQSKMRIFVASDPCILNIEDVLFGLTSTDILFHLGKEEISYPQLPDRLGRLCSHILTQRNFYPLYPPNEEVNIDYLHFELNAGMPVKPHILILPSDLRHFIKDINGCCCINPERITKRVSGGTFVRIYVKQVEKEKYSGSMTDYIQAEILKI